MNELELLVRIGNIFGLCKVKATKFTNKWNILNNIYLYLIIVQACVSFILVTVLGKIEKGMVLSWLVSFIVFGSQMFSHIIIILEALFKDKAHRVFLERVYEIETSFEIRFKQKSNKHILYRKMRNNFCFMAITSLICLFAFIYGLLALNDNAGNFWYAIFTVITLRVRILQIVCYVNVIEHYLKELNRRFNQFVILNTKQPAHILDTRLENLGTKQYLSVVKDTFGLVFDAVQQLNDFAGWSIFSILASYFFDFTCRTYWLLLAFDNLQPHYSILGTISVLISLGVIVCNLCLTCNECELQGQYMTSLVTKLINSKGIKDKTSKNFLYDLLLQLQHQQIQISAKQFYKLDLQFIMSISVAIATHLIILIQFLTRDLNTS